MAGPMVKWLRYLLDVQEVRVRFSLGPSFLILTSSIASTERREVGAANGEAIARSLGPLF